MKTILIFLTFITFSYSANLLYLEKKENGGINTYCIDDSYYYQSHRIFFHDILNNKDLNLYTSYYQKIVIIPGYDVVDTNCIFDESKYYGLTYEQYNYLMAFLGLTLGFIISLGIILAV